jgi:hypothetical protein
MRYLLCILWLLISLPAGAQARKVSFATIDDQVSGIEPGPPERLARDLTTPYSSDLEKVRAIFSWIAQHVDYHLPSRFSTHRRNSPNTRTVMEPDGSANEVVAANTLNSLSAVCEGYARLFTLLCNQAGIPSMIITGFGKTGNGKSSSKFHSNHFWNAVFIDSNWHLLDVTWASGYVSYRGDEFIRHFDDYYFLTPPRLFLEDHFPDDLAWTLLPETPVLPEFRYTPYYPRTFRKYQISSFFPAGGIIEASPGDSVVLQLETRDAEADRKIAADTLWGSFAAVDTIQAGALNVRLRPDIGRGTLRAVIRVGPETPGWIQVIYNNDIILRYYLRIRKEKNSLALNH